MSGPVVVGFDGSSASVAAVWWAAQEAVDRHAPLLLLHSWTTRPLDVPVAQEALQKQSYGGRVLQRMEAELLHHHGNLTLATELVSAPAAHALVERSDGATMLVLGFRGRGSVAGFLLGSIGLQVLGRAHCPAVTVRADDSAVPVGPRRPATADRREVVVGVPEAGPAVDPLLEFAFTTADLRGARLRAVRALPLTSWVTHPPAGRPDEGYMTDEQGRLAAAVAPWREKFPDTEVVYDVARGSAAQVLPAASTHALMTILGRRRRPSARAWNLGPVTHAALRHVACPVAVVPHD